MKADHDEDEIRQLFRQLEEQDRQLARPFSMLNQAMRRAGSAHRRRPAFRLAAALAMLVLAAFTAAIWLQARPPRAAASISQLSRWRAPTDSLLRTPGDQLLRTVPRFSAPLGGKDPFGGETR